MLRNARIANFTFVVTVALLGGRVQASSGMQTWLVVSDVHLDPFARAARPSLFGSDTNIALFRSALGEMKRRVPNPDLVVIPGDFLAHDFAGRMRGGGTTANGAVAAMRFVAGAFGRAFPRARFVVTLGNNDAPCGDYHTAFGTQYARELARVWQPLVARDGVATDFVSSFAAIGSYTTMLPGGTTRLVAFDDVPLSALYLGNCTGLAEPFEASAIAWLRETLATTPPHTNNVVVMHVPPGFDAFSTEEVRGFFAWPFLDADANALVASALADPAHRVTFAIAGHAHRFDVRLAGGVPIVVVGSLSPVYHNNPSFYAFDVGTGGRLRDIRTFAFDEWTQAWQPARSFDGKWNVQTVDAAALRELHDRLGRDEHLRREWDAATSGWPSNPHIAWSTWQKRWRIPWCAQTFLDGGFARCAGITTRTLLLRVALLLLAAGTGGVLAALAFLIGRRTSER